MLGLKEAGEAGPHAELPAAACEHSAAEAVHGQSRHLRTRRAGCHRPARPCASGRCGGGRAWAPKQPTLPRGRGSWRHPPSKAEFGKLLGMKRQTSRDTEEPGGMGAPGLGAGSPRVPGGARQSCAPSRLGLCPGGRSGPAARPRAEAWRRGAPGGAAPCGRSAVRGARRLPAQAPFHPRGAGSHLRPAGSACRAPPTYRNRLRAAGWSPRTGNTSESKPSSDTCSPRPREDERRADHHLRTLPPLPSRGPPSPGTPQPHQEQSPRSPRPRGPNSSGPEFEDSAAGPSHGADPASQTLAALHQHHLERGWGCGPGSPTPGDGARGAGGAHPGLPTGPGIGRLPPRGALTLGALGTRLRW